MAKYRKFHSNFIKTKKHKDLSDGSTTIIERDWGTLGERHRLEKGKKPVWSDTNLMFTDNSLPSLKKRHNYGEWEDSWNFDDVKDTKPDNNQVKVNMSSNDLRDFAYYGSCVELVQSTILSIIREFPGRIKVTSEYAWFPDGDGGYKETKIYTVSNPFQINLHNDNVVLDDYENPLHYMSISWGDYQVGTEGNLDDVSSFNIVKNKEIECRTEDDFSGPIYTIKIGPVTIYGYYIGRTIQYFSDNSGYIIQPKEEIIEDYFDGLEGFKKQLLTRETKPLYKNSFVTPIISAEYDPQYVFRNYTWPSDGYCIEADTPRFNSFVQKLMSLAENMDKLWCDNLWNRMTHEAIKNYDWTYTREYSDGDEEENVIGGQNIEKLMRVYGRLFDDLKRYIDGIKFTKKVTYDGYNNLAAEMSDKLEMTGWDVYSTIPNFDEDVSTTVLTEEYLKNAALSWFGKRKDDTGTDYFKHISVNPEAMNMTQQDIEFMRILRLSSKRIMQTKGTRHAIDMIMGMFGFGHGEVEVGDNAYNTEDNYEVEETYYKVALTDAHKADNLLDKVIELNDAKNGVKVYDTELTGLPLTVKTVGGEKYLVPYLEKDTVYDGDIFFQGNGGWGRNGKPVGTETLPSYGYKETVTYLNVVQNIGALLDKSYNEITEDEIFYVVSLADITDYDEDLTADEVAKMSHLFHCNDNWMPAEYSSWTNIPIADDGTELWKRGQYLENLVLTTKGNNPHVGYGYYDIGQKYKDYMGMPFKYAVDNGLFSGEYIDEAEGITFTLTDQKAEEFVKVGDRPVNQKPVGDDKKIHKFAKVLTEGMEEKDYAPTDAEYLNSKVVVFRLKGDLASSNMFRKYFQDVIVHYLMQVIPSTTILILENCMPEDE